MFRYSPEIDVTICVNGKPVGQMSRGGYLTLRGNEPITPIPMILENAVVKGLFLNQIKFIYSELLLEIPSAFILNYIEMFELYQNLPIASDSNQKTAEFICESYYNLCDIYKEVI